MSILDIFRINTIKAELAQAKQECNLLKSTLADTERMDFNELKRAIAALKVEKARISNEITSNETNAAKEKQVLQDQLGKLKQQIQEKQRDLVVMDDEALLQSFGFYKPKYELQNSEAYRIRLEQIRAEQETMVKAGKAAYGTTNWSVNNNQREGERMVKDYVKLILRSFNNECDASIVSVKFSNLEAIAKRIRKAHEALNKLGQRMSIVITSEYLNLKLAELYVCYEFQVKKQEEKEEQKRLREIAREEAKVQKEIEEARLKLEKEQKHFQRAMVQTSARLQAATNDSERDLLRQELTDLKQNMAELADQQTALDYRTQNTRAGYVYIISNLGSFGENIFKIGVTRRLDPLERIDELGDASVPFEYDIHALVFSDDAPSLENALHKAFNHSRLNRVNLRREFFRANLDEIEQVLKANFQKPAEFKHLADAAEYRQSLILASSVS